MKCIPKSQTWRPGPCGTAVWLATVARELCQPVAPYAHKELPMYENLERLFQRLATTSHNPKPVYYQLADEFFKQLRQQIEVTQTELRESEQLEIYYHAQGEEPILVPKIRYLSSGLLVLHGKDSRNNDCKV